MKKLGFYLPLLLLVGCIEQFQGQGQEQEQEQESYKFAWAIVDSSKVEQELQKIAKKQNPYPDEINANVEKLNEDYQRLTNKVSLLTREAKQKCLKVTKKTGMRSPLPANVIITSSGGSRNSVYKQDCLEKIKHDPLISDLTVKQKKLEKIKKSQRQHDNDIRKKVREYSGIVVAEFSKDRFKVVIRKDRNNILYNQEGFSLDITDAIVSQIKLREPKIPTQ